MDTTAKYALMCDTLPGFQDKWLPFPGHHYILRSAYQYKDIKEENCIVHRSYDTMFVADREFCRKHHNLGSAKQHYIYIPVIGELLTLMNKREDKLPEDFVNLLYSELHTDPAIKKLPSLEQVSLAIYVKYYYYPSQYRYDVDEGWVELAGVWGGAP